MPKFISRRGGGVRASFAPANIRVGHYYLDTRRKCLHALNETGRQLLREGVPVQRDDLLRQPLETLTGEAVTPADLPLLKAWREGASQETTFVQRKSGGS